MDEQRIEAYLNLIQELLSCPNGEKLAMLNRSSNLLDKNFLIVCQQAIEILTKKGRTNEAGFLINLAEQLAEYLNIGNSEETVKPESHKILADYQEFLQELIRIKKDSNSDKKVVYHFLKEHQNKLDLTFAEVITQWFNSKIDPNNPELNQAIASLLNSIAVHIQEFLLGRHLNNIEIAIAFYNNTLTVYTKDAFPEDWAITQNNLGLAYQTRIKGSRTDNLESAIACYNNALTVYTKDAFPEQWAGTQNNLATAYRIRIKGLKADNLESAITCFQSALTVRTKNAFPKDWADTQNNLANAYCNRIKGSKADNLESAITCFQSALTVYTPEAFPEQWATTQHNLGTAYSDRIKGPTADNLELAITCFQSALTVTTKDAFPEDWADTQYNLAIAYSNRIKGSKADNLESAIACYQSALTVDTPDAFPQYWADTQNNLGLAYSNRIKGSRADNLESAITCYQSALTVYTPDAFPQDWATTQNNLATAYCKRIKGSKADNLESAIACYQSALTVYTPDAFPEDWAITQNNLGLAYSDRIKESKADNLERAIACYQNALTVRTKDAFPQYWADTQNNLANAYQTRIKGSRADNLESAIACLQSALQVYTRDAFPEKWAGTQNNLAVAYGNRIKGSRADNLESAIACYQSALTVRTREAFPQNNTETLYNLGLAYLDQSHYYNHDPVKKQIALDDAFQTFKAALDVVEYIRGEIIDGEAKTKLNEEWNRLYLSMVRVCLELGQYDNAIEYADRSKARNLVELIAIRDAYPEGDIPTDVRQRLQELRNLIAEEDRRLQQDRNPEYTYIKQLRQEYQAKFPYKPINFAGIQKLLDGETAILEWYILEDKFLIFTITSQNIYLWQSSQEDLNKLIDWGNEYLGAYYQAKELKQAASQAEKEKAEELLTEAQNIWQNPLAERLEKLSALLHLDDIIHQLFKYLPNCQKLILIPHLYLHLFPLQALPVKNPANNTNIVTLQELFAKGITYTPNCQLLQQSQNRYRPNFKKLLAVQNPTNDKDLLFADLEVETIRKIFPQRITLGTNATKDKFLKQNLTQIHHLFFSCHAGFNTDSALDSGLLLAGNDILTLEEIIASLNLSNCSLVTLSACETGQVALDSTDEYISLSSGFILAGSPTVLASLWSVKDVTSALLLIKTYEYLEKHPGQIAIALKNAQIWLRDSTIPDFQTWVKKCSLFSDDWRAELIKFFQNMWENNQNKENYCPYQSPYYWAAFCVVGQGEQIMAGDNDKIQAFTNLLLNNSHDIRTKYQQDLQDLKSQLSQLGDDQETNVKAIEQWLETRPTLREAYQEQLTNLSSSNSLLEATGERGIGGSKPQPNPPIQSLSELLDNMTKPNTNLPPTPTPTPQ